VAVCCAGTQKVSFSGSKFFLLIFPDIGHDATGVVAFFVANFDCLVY
jgi:hypothetical protein